MLRLNGGNTVTLGRTEVQNPELRFPSGFTTFSESSLGTCPESHFERQESGFRDREINTKQRLVQVHVVRMSLQRFQIFR